MRTSLNIPEELMEEAQEILGIKSKTEAVIYSLKEIIRRKKLEELKSLPGKIHLDIDLNRSRRRFPR